eukprot:scpid57757/ scgid35285/ 
MLRTLRLLVPLTRSCVAGLIWPSSPPWDISARRIAAGKLKRSHPRYSEMLHSSCYSLWNKTCLYPTAPTAAVTTTTHFETSLTSFLEPRKNRFFCFSFSLSRRNTTS